MNMYRLHIDIPIDGDLDQVIAVANSLVAEFTQDAKSLVGGMNYRLGHDEDRQKSNYMMMDENGHVNNKKIRLTFDTETV